MEQPKLTKKEKEFIELVGYWDKIYRDYEQQGGKPDKGTEFMKLVRKLKDDIISKTEQKAAREKKQEDRKAKQAIKQMIECPGCETMDKVRYIGEGKNPTGYTVPQYFCSKCNKQYYHYYPNNARDELKWHENLSKQMKKTIKENKSFAKQLGPVLKDTQKLEKYTDMLKEEIRLWDATEKAFKEADRTLNDLRDKYAAIMLREQIKRTNTWGGRQGSS